jgi:glycosyltransferase involved in cell wall biosynthesis
LGQVVMEAQASGLPCVVSNEGGVTDIVVQHETGFCIPVTDKAQWREKCRMLIENETLREKMGSVAHRRMQNRSIERTYGRFMQVHSEIAAVGLSENCRGEPAGAGR